jgi:hypothetical protein
MTAMSGNTAMVVMTTAIQLRLLLGWGDRGSNGLKSASGIRVMLRRRGVSFLGGPFWCQHTAACSSVKRLMLHLKMKTVGLLYVCTSSNLFR